MTAGPRLVLDVVAGIVSLYASTRDRWADVAGFDLNDYGGLDRDERRVVWPGHVWGMCLEPSTGIRERFLSSIDSLAVLTPISPTFVAEVLGWLAVTGTDPRTEVDYVETFTEIVEANDATPEVPLVPERVAPFVDVLRGITSASVEERARAAQLVPALLPELRREEQWGITGVLARAAIVETDAEVRAAQLGALIEGHRAGTVHENDGRLLGEAFAGAPAGTVERDAADELGAG